jgi:hypothetical protein
MNPLVRTASLVAAFALVAGPAAEGTSIDVSVLAGTPSKVQVRDPLQHLHGQHDVSEPIFTGKVLIDERSISHSHPMLPLSTRDMNDGDLLIATFLHAPPHRGPSAQQASTDAAVAELRPPCPGARVAARAGARNGYSTYLLRVVCDPERPATAAVLGEERARCAMEFLANDHSTWVCRTVLNRGGEIERIALSHGRLPVEG